MNRHALFSPFLALCLVLVWFTPRAVAANSSASPEAAPASTATTGRMLVVGTKEAPPFAIKDENGHWSGIAIDLWRIAAHDLGYRYEFREKTLDGLLNGVADHSLDAAVAAITVTASREKIVDFSQPYFITGLGIAVPNRQEAGWIAALMPFFSPAFLKAVLGLAVLLLIAGGLVWLFERRRNPEQFAEGPGRGLLASFWWAAVTMTTVGYGDKAPSSTPGRIIGIIWMFAGVIVISGFTAAITSSLTLNRLQGPVQGLSDLPRARVGTVAASTSAAYLTSQHLAFSTFNSPMKALTALDQGRLDAVVYDAPILKYDIRRDFHGKLRVLPGTFDRQYYGIALPPDSPLRERLDQAILRHINSPQWQTSLAQYLGK